jgi:hypothetical protein
VVYLPNGRQLVIDPTERLEITYSRLLFDTVGHIASYSRGVLRASSTDLMLPNSSTHYTSPSAAEAEDV